ncbi:MAG TPA: glycosyltransferase [Smithella sp.]|nr:glycosyltransferase [Smithella sp.]
MSNRLVSVVIPCFNVADTIERLIRSLHEQQLPDSVELEIVAVDNGSTDGTLELLSRLPVRVVEESKCGPAAARNAGVRAARGEIIVFLDADMRAAHSRLIAEHLKTIDRHVDAGISGGAITHDPKQRSLIAFAENATAQFNWHDRLPAGELTFQPAGNQAFCRTLFDELGPWNESLLYLEDFEWSQRVIRSGRKIYFNPAAGAYITGRESLGAIIYKFYTWGLNVREFYLPGRTSQVWLFRDNSSLFWVNAPLRMLNETWVTVKRWFPFYPVKTLLLIPLFLIYRAAWATGMVVGAYHYFKKR